ncbi:CapA family protein [Bacillus sp. B15-48]|uniref:CapA family protein n=1 Tax=Bacillus sp. B15-48 TaxID=1548601 RepID=UPI00193F52F0|nr:CapA family protein [Bacillus sp. B15-48]MBM4763449.1 CapA family protein [Bacillus sp. B15-48]
MKKNKHWVFVFSMIFILLITTGFIFLQKEQSHARTNDKLLIQEPHAIRSYAVTGKTYEQTVTLGAVGDILIHDRVYEAARTTDGFDFKPMFADVKHMMMEPDLLLANQETILAGEEIGLSSYPSFNSPHEVGFALLDAGVNIVSTANNHTLDRGERGIQLSMNFLNEIGLPYVGSFKDFEDKDTLRVLTNNGIKVAYLSYTYGTNGIPVPENKEYLVNLIDKEAMKIEIHRATAEADIVVMSIHWGNEYQRYPDEIQKELAHFLVNEGVDIIFGHHPHVLQPMEWLKNKDGRKSLVVYSLGNFLSGQKWDYKDIGGIVSIEIKKQIGPSGTTIELGTPIFKPTYVSSYGQRQYRLVPLENAGDFGLVNAQAKYDEIMAHMTENLN